MFLDDFNVLILKIKKNILLIYAQIIVDFKIQR